MIYIPLELRLKMIQEDLQEIKSHMQSSFDVIQPPECANCNMAKVFGGSPCSLHAQEYNMRIKFYDD